MSSIVDRIIEILATESPQAATNVALANAAFAFEKARGLEPCGWTDEVLHTVITPTDVRRLREALIRFVEQRGFGTWALSKCGGPALKPIFVSVVRRQLDDDPDELYQAMLALSECGEDVFAGRPSMSISDVKGNRDMAKAYLLRIES